MQRFPEDVMQTILSLKMFNMNLLVKKVYEYVGEYKFLKINTVTCMFNRLVKWQYKCLWQMSSLSKNLLRKWCNMYIWDHWPFLCQLHFFHFTEMQLVFEKVESQKCCPYTPTLEKYNFTLHSSFMLVYVYVCSILLQYDIPNELLSMTTILVTHWHAVMLKTNLIGSEKTLGVHTHTNHFISIA